MYYSSSFGHSLIASTTLPLHVKLERAHYAANGEVHVKCVARISTMFVQPVETDGNAELAPHNVINAAELEFSDAEIRHSKNLHNRNRYSPTHGFLYRRETMIAGMELSIC